MATAESQALLVNGERLPRDEFLRRYEQHAKDEIIELIRGRVFVASPQRLEHSDHYDEVAAVLRMYRRATKGVQVTHTVTTLLEDDSAPQPDLGLRVLPEYGGTSSNTPRNYVLGPPELLVEISYSTRTIDMHEKRLTYRRAGVTEYAAVCIEEREVHWFGFKLRKALAANRTGVFRSRAFPGLWLNGPALFDLDSDELEATARAGLATPEHAEFARLLASRKSGV